MRKHLTNWGVVYILIILFLLSWGGQFYNQVVIIGEGGPKFWAATFENWQSEMAQLALQAVLVASYLSMKIFRADSGADKEDVKRIESKLDRIIYQQGPVKSTGIPVSEAGKTNDD